VFQFDSHELGVDLEDAVAGCDKLELKKNQQKLQVNDLRLFDKILYFLTVRPDSFTSLFVSIESVPARS
jgi:hypothetical protein